ncbi:unnamed protein product [Dibothriocephalus latus]|uniref:Golgi SNAP receptor complex member 1 n=1 Tax=Dibothriocephalus latus TaxID=60516 RepID=A0A3P7LR90_DIBLA|nr:unnamed protein product [Dibothriocephalus latus]
MRAIQWDDLRRQARTLENDLDSKLASFGKLGSAFGMTNYGYMQPSNQPANDTSSEYNLLSCDIENLLERLTQVNDKMTELVSSIEPSAVGSISQQHTAKRHREILYDYIQDFKRIRSSYINAKNREELFASALTKSPEKPRLDSTRLLLEENQSLLNADQALSERIAAASAIRSSLRSQHHVLKSATNSLLNLRNRFPIVNKLLNQISWRKQRDSIIVGTVFGCCLLFLLFYLFH